MNLLNVLKKDCIAAHVPVGADEVLERIAEQARQYVGLHGFSQNAIVNALKEREALGSTGFGGGIAIPHCRMDSVKEYVVGLLTVPEGVEFDALDGQPVRLFVFVVAPATQSDVHIKMLSSISQVLNIPGAVDEMVREPTAEGLYESFARHVADEVDEHNAHEYNLFHVFIQNENMFQDVLQVFGGLESGTAVVLDAQHSSRYLSKMPLFAGFWSDPPSSFSQLIVALVNKRMTNETIRRVERVTGSLNECEDVLLTVQELFFCAGGLTR